MFFERVKNCQTFKNNQNSQNGSKHSKYKLPKKVQNVWKPNCQKWPKNCQTFKNNQNPQNGSKYFFPKNQTLLNCSNYRKSKNSIPNFVQDQKLQNVKNLVSDKSQSTKLYKILTVCPVELSGLSHLAWQWSQPWKSKGIFVIEFAFSATLPRRWNCNYPILHCFSPWCRLVSNAKGRVCCQDLSLSVTI